MRNYRERGQSYKGTGGSYGDRGQLYPPPRGKYLQNDASCFVSSERRNCEMRCLKEKDSK